MYRDVHTLAMHHFIKSHSKGIYCFKSTPLQGGGTNELLHLRCVFIILIFMGIIPTVSNGAVLGKIETATFSSFFI